MHYEVEPSPGAGGATSVDISVACRMSRPLLEKMQLSERAPQVRWQHTCSLPPSRRMALQGDPGSRMALLNIRVVRILPHSKPERPHFF